MIWCRVCSVLQYLGRGVVFQASLHHANGRRVELAMHGFVGGQDVQPSCTPVSHAERPSLPIRRLQKASKGSHGHRSIRINCTSIRFCSFVWASANEMVQGHLVFRKVRTCRTQRSSILHLCFRDNPGVRFPTQFPQNAAHMRFSVRRKHGQGEVSEEIRCPRMSTVSCCGHFA